MLDPLTSPDGWKSRDTEFAVAVENVGAGGRTGRVAALIYVMSEKSDHPFTFLTLYLNRYITPDSIPAAIV